MYSRFFLNILILLSITTSALAETKHASLYTRLGEKRAIAAVVDEFVNLAAVDPKANFTRNGKFKSMDVPFLKGQLTDFISMVTGGPVKYNGKDMAAAHTGMKIKASEFDALAADLVKALDKFNVPTHEKNELMALVASTKAAIVEVDDQAKPTTTPPTAAPQAPAAQGNSLFTRLGGTPAITAVVDSFVNTAAGDKRVNFFRDGQFKNINVPHLKEQLVKFITMATGGPKNYNGLDMKTAHEGMKIKASEFDAIAEDLSLTLDQFKVPAKEKAELMAIAASTKKDIVSK